MWLGGWKSSGIRRREAQLLRASSVSDTALFDSLVSVSLARFYKCGRGPRVMATGLLAS